MLDVLKGLLPTFVAGHWFGAHAAYAVGIAAVLGHIWSPYLKGRGGKGVATTLGAILGVHPWVALVVVVVFGVAFALTRWVAAGSIFGALAMLVVAVLIWTGHAPGDVWTGRVAHGDRPARARPSQEQRRRLVAPASPHRGDLSSAASAARGDCCPRLGGCSRMASDAVNAPTASSVRPASTRNRPRWCRV